MESFVQNCLRSHVGSNKEKNTHTHLSKYSHRIRINSLPKLDLSQFRLRHVSAKLYRVKAQDVAISEC